MKESQITQHLHSDGATIAAALLLVATTIVAMAAGVVLPIEGDRGLALPSTNLWLPHGWLSLWINLGLIGLIAICASALNKSFNIMRSLTSLWATMFIALMIPFPIIDGQLSGATLLPLIWLTDTALLYKTYDTPSRRRSIFLIFFLLSAASLIQYGYMFYIPVFAIGMVQMRVLNARSAIAALLGIVTTPWVMFGTGLLSIDDVSWPEFVSSFYATDTREMVVAIVVVGFSALLGAGFFLGNMVKLLSYNARNRAFNGFITISLLSTVVLLMIDYNNLALYSMLLNLLAAYQVAHFFSMRRATRSYIPILLIIALALGLYILTIWAN